MPPFAEAIERAVSLKLESEFTSEEAAPYLRAPDRRREAAQVDSCVDRFIDYELTPPPGEAVGRKSYARTPPALASVLGDKLDGISEEQRARLRLAVATSLAVGYGAIAAVQSIMPEMEMRPARTPEQVWEFLGGQLLRARHLYESGHPSPLPRRS